MDDLIKRQDAVNELSYCQTYLFDSRDHDKKISLEDAEYTIERLPSAQPGIIRCKDCKYRDENWRRVSVRWLPCMDVRTGSNWYCGSAERKDDE